MPRLLVIASLVALVLVPTTGASPSRAHVRGTVGSKSQPAHLVSVRTSRTLFALRVPGSLSRIRVGAHVELRGSTLRSEDHGSSLLATGVAVVATSPLAAPQTPTASDDQGDDDQPGAQEVEDDNGGPSAVDDHDDDVASPAATAGSDDHHGGGAGSGDDDSGTDE